MFYWKICNPQLIYNDCCWLLCGVTFMSTHTFYLLLYFYFFTVAGFCPKHYSYMSLLILIPLYISRIVPFFISLLCPHTARLCRVFHYPTNVLVTESLICESTLGQKQVRSRERTRANISKDKRENYRQGPQASLSLSPSPQCPLFFFPSFSYPL